MSNYSEIRSAIINKQQLTFDYKGHFRKACPHVIGKAKSGEDHVLVFQFGGSSSTDHEIKPNSGVWRCMNIGEIKGLSKREGQWYSKDNHSRRQPCVFKIDVEVKY